MSKKKDTTYEEMAFALGSGVEHTLRKAPRQEPPAKNFGLAIRAIRAKKGLTQVEFAIRLGMSPQQVYHYEKGTHLPRLPVVARMAKVLGISMDALYRLWEGDQTCRKKDPRSP